MQMVQCYLSRVSYRVFSTCVGGGGGGGGGGGPPPPRKFIDQVAFSYFDDTYLMCLQHVSKIDGSET